MLLSLHIVLPTLLPLPLLLLLLLLFVTAAAVAAAVAIVVEVVVVAAASAPFSLSLVDTSNPCQVSFVCPPGEARGQPRPGPPLSNELGTSPI